jgi:hypothetical protein
MLNWSAPVSVGGSGTPTGYVVYRSTDGRGFGNPLVLGNVTSTTLTGLPTGTALFFRVAATNAGGESFPSETATCRLPTAGQSIRVLMVNAFDRFDRGTNLKQILTAKAYAPPGKAGTAERVLPLRSNAFDYLVQHAEAVSAHGFAFDSCANDTVGPGSVPLASYPIVMWANGQESTTDESFSATEQSRIATFRNGGGHLMVSGSEIGWDLDRDSGPTAADRSFYNNHLKADLGGNVNDDSASYSVAPVAGGLFAGRAAASFDNGSPGLYRVQTPDILTPSGPGTSAALSYHGVAPGAAAIQYNGSAGGGRVVYLGFPFETIGNATRRREYMTSILDFFTVEADAADPDLDQLANLIEYSTGSDPLAPDFTPPLTAILPSDSLSIQLYHNTTAIGIRSTVETTSNPAGSWTALARSTAGAAYAGVASGWTIHESGPGTRHLVTLAQAAVPPGPAPARQFFRLRVERY